MSEAATLTGTPGQAECMTDHRLFPVAVHLVLQRGDEVLLMRRMNTGYFDGYYSLVAGHLEGDETVPQAMIREAQEEIGIEVELTALKLVGVMHRLSDTERIEFFLSAHRWQGAITNQEPGKCDEVRWFDMAHLPDKTIPYITEALEFIRRPPLGEGLWFDEPDFG